MAELQGQPCAINCDGSLMKSPQISDNLFLEGLSVSQVDSISQDLTVSGCAPSFISLESVA